MGLFKPAWQSKNKKRALQAVEKETCQIKLGVIAKESPYSIAFGIPDLGCVAVEKLTDQSVLADLAFNARDSNVRWHATIKLTDLNILMNIAENDADPYLRLTAFRKLPEQMRSQKMRMDIAVNGCGSSEQAEIIKQLTDQDILTRITADKVMGKLAHKRLFELAILELEQIDDQNILADIARNENHKAQIHAIKKLTDQTVLADIAIHGNYRVKEFAISRLSDQNVLAEIAMNTQDNGNGEAAINRIYDQAMLYKIALNAANKLVANKAVEKLNNQDLLADLVNNAKPNPHPYIDTWKDVRILAIEKLKDQDLLAKIARNKNERGYTRRVAIEQLADKNILAEIINSAAENYGYTRSVSVITGRTELDQTWEQQEFTEDLREVALERLAQL
jgi:hypothetical protein